MCIANNVQIRLIAGLGNPGKEYEQTRHNIGFMVIDRLLESLGPKKWGKTERFNSVYWEGRCRGSKIILQKPLTYMNLSGKAICRLMSVLNIKPDELLLIFDDMDLPLGRIRIKKNGSAGSHNGAESVISELNTNSFIRLRIGIDKNCENNWKDYVLDNFTEKEMGIVAKVINQTVEAVKMLLYSGTDKAMNEFNGIAIQ